MAELRKVRNWMKKNVCQHREIIRWKVHQLLREMNDMEDELSDLYKVRNEIAKARPHFIINLHTLLYVMGAKENWRRYPAIPMSACYNKNCLTRLAPHHKKVTEDRLRCMESAPCELYGVYHFSTFAMPEHGCDRWDYYMCETCWRKTPIKMAQTLLTIPEVQPNFPLATDKRHIRYPERRWTQILEEFLGTQKKLPSSLGPYMEPRGVRWSTPLIKDTSDDSDDSDMELDDHEVFGCRLTYLDQ